MNPGGIFQNIENKSFMAVLPLNVGRSMPDILSSGSKGDRAGYDWKTTYLAIVHVVVAKTNFQELQRADLAVTVVVCLGKKLIRKHDPASNITSVMCLMQHLPSFDISSNWRKLIWPNLGIC